MGSGRSPNRPRSPLGRTSHAQIHRLLVGAVAAAYVGAAAAENLIIGVAKETSSVDPHWHTLPPNYQIADHMFDPLVMKDHRQIHVPALAESWKPIDDKVWEIPTGTPCPPTTKSPTTIRW